MEVLGTKFCDQEAQGTTLEPGGMGATGAAAGVLGKRGGGRQRKKVHRKKITLWIVSTPSEIKAHSS